MPPPIGRRHRPGSSADRVSAVRPGSSPGLPGDWCPLPDGATVDEAVAATGAAVADLLDVQRRAVVADLHGAELLVDDVVRRPAFLVRLPGRADPEEGVLV